MQFSTAYAAMTMWSLAVQDVHPHYLNSGGFFDELEIDAYLHGLTPLPREERDCLAQAINELIDDLRSMGASGHRLRASYSGMPCISSAAAAGPARQRLTGERHRRRVS